MIFRLQDIKEKLEKEIQHHKYYRDPEINLDTLSRYIGTNRSYLSITIMYGYGCNFCTYINRLRLAEIFDYGDSVFQSEDSLYDIAVMCGFNSKRTFNRAFSREKGLLPIDFVAGYKKLSLQNHNQ
ncbi:MAG: AraC family transcriptional regulator [Prevotellaceae bacterium]|jgi:AraC-like DNA-binding protein|nr:AraC family transcriptional regulator [Prevotellaceae bacterium]